MKKQALAIALASVVGTFAAVGPANAVPPPAPSLGAWTNPSLFNSERSAVCLVESALSIVAANVAHSGCTAASKGSYYLEVEVDVAGNGTASLDAIALSNRLLEPAPILGKGQRCQVRQQGQGRLFTPAKGGGVQVAGYQGDHAWNYTNTIFLDHAPPFTVGGVSYDEHSIKDFYKPACSNGSCITTEDYGFEVITKNTYYPREKWWEQSQYRRENGSDGYLRVVKNRLIPKASCSIELIMEGANVGNEFGYSGNIRVYEKATPWASGS